MMKSAELFVAGEKFVYDHDVYIVDVEGRCLNVMTGEILDIVDFYDYLLEEITLEDAAKMIAEY